MQHGESQPESRSARELIARLERLTELGTALSAEADSERLIERLLAGAKELTRADGGTLYLLNDARTALEFRLLRNDSLALAEGGSAEKPVEMAPVPLYLPDGAPNHHNVAAHVALTGATVNLEDAYTAAGFDFSGTREFDRRMGYRSVSFLTIPLRNHEQDVIGVLQLLNAQDETGRIRAFSAEDRRLAESLAAQAATALTQQQLIHAQRALFESFIRLVARAIDEKSEYTSGHCQRVPELTLMLADAAVEDDSLADKFRLSPAERYELRIAAWLHDCGKVATPDWVMDKARRLDAFRNRLSEVEARFEVVRRERENAHLRGRLEVLEHDGTASAAHAERAFQDSMAKLDEDLAFIRQADASEVMAPEDQERIREIQANYAYTDAYGQRRPVLTDEEVEALCVPRGTLTEAERQTMQDHVSITIDMLEALPYPKGLERVPEIAGSHHERLDGGGYPRGLKGEEIPVGGRMMAIADVFEALTAADRPYKQPKSLSEALAILGHMKQEGHLDPDLFDLFIRSGVYRRYAERYMPPEQIDAVDVTAIPGYSP